MKKNSVLLDAIINNAEEGIIFINSEEKFELINTRAKEIIGIILDKDQSHPAGKINPGDIVIIADNAIGNDDGNLTPKDLELINVHDPNIKNGHIFLGMGVYKNPGIVPIYKFISSADGITDIELEANFLGFSIKIEINSTDGNMNIFVNGTQFRMTFFESIGHAVIIDGTSAAVKFFQAKGYTVRKDSLANVLHGKPFLAKGGGEESLNVIGVKLDEVTENSELNDRIKYILQQKADSIPAHEEGFYDINKRLALCTVIPVCKEDKVEGVILKIKDASDLETLFLNRNKILEDVEHRRKHVFALTNGMDNTNLEGFVGNTPVMKEVLYLAKKAAKSKMNVLLTGESGTGKSRLAFEIHEMANKIKGGPFIAVNCASIPSGLFESELFGYVGGAFTGALEKGKIGYFERANGGTIFLDEIGELPVDIQVKLLQVLQTKQFYRVGSSVPMHIDFRVIAATNMDMEEAIRTEVFRSDLYYRLNVFPIHIPPLRERHGDLYVLINQMLKGFCTEYELPEKQLSAIALRAMLNYNWPGNVRELENVIARAVAVCDSNIIFPEHINIRSLDGDNIDTSLSFSEHPPLKELLEIAERKYIEDAILYADGDKKRAIEILDISKTSFYDKCKRYGLDKKHNI